MTLWKTLVMSRLLPDDQVCEAYCDTRSNVLELLKTTSEDSATSIVPACPAWTVQQTAAHLVGVPEDLLAGRMEGITTDAWTDAQVRRHSGESLLDLAAALEATIAEFDVMLPAIPSPSNSQMVMDAVTHEIDLREALGLPVPETSLAVRVALAWLLDMVDRRAPEHAGRLAVDGVSDLAMLRALTGRLSPSTMDELGLPGSAIAIALEGTPLRPPA